MLNPAALSKSLAHTLGGELRMCLLLTPQSRLIAYASLPPSAEDLMKILLGLSGEAWRDAEVEARGRVKPGETPKEQEFIRLECEVCPLLALSALFKVVRR